MTQKEAVLLMLVADGVERLLRGVLGEAFGAARAADSIMRARIEVEAERFPVQEPGQKGS